MGGNFCIYNLPWASQSYRQGSAFVWYRSGIDYMGYLSMPQGATRNEMATSVSVSATLSQTSTTLALILSHCFLQIDFTRVH